tara:strand:+ start:47 stop:364 length:318 start_codon:yes stop_codon:yes gene_type:complete
MSESADDKIKNKLNEYFGTSGTGWVDRINSATLQAALFMVFSIADSDLEGGLPVDDPDDVVIKAKGDEPAKTGHDIMDDIQAPYKYLALVISAFVQDEIARAMDE